MAKLLFVETNIRKVIFWPDGVRFAIIMPQTNKKQALEIAEKIGA